MAVGDFGGGLLAGMQGVQAFAQQRRDNAYRQDALQIDRNRLGQAAKEHEDRVAQWGKDNDINKRNATVAERNASTNEGDLEVSQGNLEVSRGQLKIAQNEDARTQTEFDQGQASIDGRNNMALGDYLGLVDPEDPLRLKVTQLTSELASGDNRLVDQLSITALNKTPRAKGFTFTAIDRTTVPGKAIVRGRYEDGREGVMTAEGGIQEGEEVVALDFNQAAKLISNEYGPIAIAAYGGNGVREILAKQGLNDATIDEKVKSAEQQTAVMAAVDATNEVGMARAFRSALASAKNEQERQQILGDTAKSLGVEYNPPVATPRDQIVDYNIPADAYTSSDGQSQIGFDARKLRRPTSVSRVKAIARRTAALEEKAKTQSGLALQKTNEKLDELYNDRQELVERENTESLRLIDGELADLQARFDKAAPARKEFWQGKLDEKNAKRDEIRTALGEITPAMQTDSYKQLEAEVFTRLEGMPKAEIDAAVDSGDLPFSPEQVSTMRQRAQEAGIEKPADLAKLPSKERLGYYALLSTIAGDANQREAFRNENANLLETGTASMSAKDADTSQRDRLKIGNERDRIAASLYSYRTARVTALESAKTNRSASVRRAGEVASEILMAEDRIFFDSVTGEFKGSLEAARRYSRELPAFQAKAAEFRPGTEEFDLVDASISAGVSNVVGAYVADGDSTFVDGAWALFFRDDPNGQTSDFSLSRVVVDNPDKPTKLMYLGPGGRVVQGAEMSLTGLQEIDNNVYNIVRKRAIQNSRERLTEG